MNSHAVIASKIALQLARHLGMRLRSIVHSEQEIGEQVHHETGALSLGATGVVGDSFHHVSAALSVSEDSLVGRTVSSRFDWVLRVFPLQQRLVLGGMSRATSAALVSGGALAVAVGIVLLAFPWISAHLVSWQDSAARYIEEVCVLLPKHWPGLSETIFLPPRPN